MATPELTGVKELNITEFVASWAKQETSEVREKLASCTRSALVAFSEGLLKQVTEALQQLAAAVAPDATADDDERSASADAALQALRLAAQLCTDALHESSANTPDALMSAAVQLHDHALLELGDARPDVQDAVVKLCVAWWVAGADSREYLVSQALPYLLLRAISSGKALHVKACYAMREALELLDFEDASITDMKRMLLQAAISPAFVSRPEGRKFLSCLLTVHPSMVQEMASVIRNQIPAGRRSVLDAYGEVILRGWRDAVGPCLAEIEGSIIQNLIRAALHGSGSGLVANIRRVLGELHRAKRLGGACSVDGMLVRLYEPLLFRALDAANTAVRRNALQLLLDAFPLLDPESPPEEQDELLVRQFAALSSGLGDACPAVRAVAAQGVAAILNLYWEIIPSATTAGFVARLTGQLAFDSALPAVRVAVLEGLQVLVDNAHAQPVLARALPQLAPLMSDPSPRVREAMVDLLLCISTSRGLHFWEVVPLASLLEALEIEAGSASGLALKLHQLLVPSYLPNAEEGVARIAALLKESPGAGQAFCRMLVAPFLHLQQADGKGSGSVHVPLEDVLQLAQGLMAYLQQHNPVAEPSSPPRKQQARGQQLAPANAGRSTKRKQVRGVDGVEDADASASQDVPAVGVRDESPETWGALLAGLAELCAGIGEALCQEICDEADVVGLFDEAALEELLSVAPTPESAQCVWRIAEALPALHAARRLLSGRMRLLASGELLPHGVDATAAVMAAVGDDNASNGGAAAAASAAAAELACLAAAATGPKLSALLAASLGLAWPGADAQHRRVVAGGSGKHSHPPTAAPKAAAAAAGEEEERDGDDLACGACGSTRHANTMLLCDGCDAALHTTCLDPPLEAVPEGDWLCPHCVTEVAAGAPSAGDALACIALLLSSDSGRALLSRGGLLAAALPLLEREATAALASARRGADTAAARSGGAAATAAAGLAASAGALALLHARATLHSLALDQEAPMRLAAVADGATHALQPLAGCCCLLQQLCCGGGAKASSTASALSARTATQLLSLAGYITRLIIDVCTALRALASCPALAVGGGAGCSVSAAASVAAECGASLLDVLLSTAAGLVTDDKASAAVQEALGFNTQLLRALLALPGDKDAPSSLQQQQRTSAWLLRWLEALATGPLAVAGGALKPDVSAIVATLLLPRSCSSSDGAPHRGVLMSRGDGNVAAVVAEGNEEAGAAGMDEYEWLAPLALAAAAAEEDPHATQAPHGSSNEDREAGSSDVDANENTVPIAGAVGKKLAGKRGVTSSGLLLPPLVQAFVSATGRHKQAQPELARRCVSLGLSRGTEADWEHALGALRLARLLARRPGGADGAALAALRDAAAADKGGAALALVGELAGWLDGAVSAG